MWQGLSGLRENLGKGLQEFKKEALRESSTLIREVSKVRPALIKETLQVNGVDLEQTEQHASELTSEVKVHDEDTAASHEGWNNGWEEGEPQEEGSAKEEPEALKVDGDKGAEIGEAQASRSGVVEEGSFVDLDIHASFREEQDGLQEGGGARGEANHHGLQAGTDDLGAQSSNGTKTMPQEESPSVALVQKQLGELTGQRDRLAERLDLMEDELEAAKAHQASLEAALSAVRQEAAVAKEERNKAEAKATRQEMEASAAKKKQEALEGKVKALAGGLEHRMQGLTQELETRTAELSASRAEVAEARNAFDEVKGMLQENAADRDRLAEELEAINAQLQQAKEEAAKHKHEAESTRREIAESVAELAEVRADLWATKEAAKGNALGEDERASLEAALKAVSASAQTAASEAGAWKVRAEVAEGQVATLKESLASAEAAVAASEQRVLEAEMAAQEAARAANQAQLSSAELKEQSEQRSRIFRAAVKAAVEKIQMELEHERDVAQERAQLLDVELREQTAALRETQTSLESVSSELGKEQKIARELEETSKSQKERLETLLAKLSEAEDEARAQRRQAEAARGVASTLTQKMASAEVEFAENRATSQMASQQRDWAEKRLAAETERLSHLLEEVERERDNVKASACEAASRSAEEVASSRARVAELEGKLAAVESRAIRISEEARVRAELGRSSAGTGRGKAAGSGLEDLGLEGVRWKASDGWESQGEARSRRKRKGPAEAGGSWWSREADHEAGARGRISKRTAVVLLYLFILHILVMVSFTSRATPALCIDAGATLENQLPG